jgi:hypothetical protein
MFLTSHNQIHYSKDSKLGKNYPLLAEEAHSTGLDPEPAWQGQV